MHPCMQPQQASTSAQKPVRPTSHCTTNPTMVFVHPSSCLPHFPPNPNVTPPSPALKSNALTVKLIQHPARQGRCGATNTTTSGSSCRPDQLSPWETWSGGVSGHVRETRSWRPRGVRGRSLGTWSACMAHITAHTVLSAVAWSSRCRCQSTFATSSGKRAVHACMG
jgi:hypothetical protein